MGRPDVLAHRSCAGALCTFLRSRAQSRVEVRNRANDDESALQCRLLWPLFTPEPLTDSADRDREKVVVSAVVVGDQPRWIALRKAWRERLNQDNLDYFKSSQCRHLRNQFFKYRDQIKYPPPSGRAAADKVQADLDRIIYECQLLVMGITQNRAGNDADPAARNPQLRYKALMRFMTRVISWLRVV
jgi:hypothetical protein